MKIWLNELLRSIFGEGLYNTLTSKIDYSRSLSKYYLNSESQDSVSPFVIFMADGKTTHGGLADRLRGMVSLYHFSKMEGLDFRIYFVSPFNLSDYLQPNTYNWEIGKNEISYYSTNSQAVIVKNNRKDNLKYVKKRLGKNVGKRQLHVYTNILIKGFDFHSVFFELFKPSVPLQNELEFHKKQIGNRYVSVTYRFQQLLGDFKEGHYKILPEREREQLIIKCLNFIKDIREQYDETYKILVTSDSETFLQEAKAKFGFVYTIPGKVFHIDYTNENGGLVYMKSFVDLFMLSRAECLYNYATGDMYKESGFPALAALIGNKPFKRVIE